MIVVYLCKPVNEIKYTNTLTIHNGARLQSAQTVSSREDEECREIVGTKYKEYCQEALGAQGTYALNMSMMAEFAFVPSFLDMSVQGTVLPSY
jgi:hypothetical protein